MSDALLEAIQTRDVDRLAGLLAASADPNQEGNSRYGSGREFPLHAAIGELEAFEASGPDGPEPAGPIDAVVLLLRHGAAVKGWDVNQEGDPLFLAVLMKHIEAVRLLLAAGADPNVKDDEGRSPLRFCAQEGLLEMARLLLHCGAGKTIDEAGGSGAGMNALGWAATRLDVEMVRLLLSHGANPQEQDNDLMTPLDRFRYEFLPEDPAGQERFEEICRLLGATPSEVPIKRRTGQDE
jgi:uncharacterized protein